MMQIFQVIGPKQRLYIQIDGQLRAYEDAFSFNKKFRNKKYMSNRINATNVDRLSFTARVGFPQLLKIGDELDITAVALHNALVGLAETRADASFTIPADLKRFFEPRFNDYGRAVVWFEIVHPALLQGRAIPDANHDARIDRDRELADPSTARYWARLAGLTTPQG